MKKTLIALALVILASGCTQPIRKYWSEDGILSLAPATWGKSLWSAQDSYSLSGSNGKSIWTKTFQGAKWVVAKNFDGNLLLVGDDRIIEKIDLDGNVIWRWETPVGQMLYPFATDGIHLVCAHDRDVKSNTNSVDIQTIDMTDGSMAWQLQDVDYSGVLTLKQYFGKVTHFVVPNIVGDSVFLEGFSVADGKFLWRRTWDKAPSGQQPVIDSDTNNCWIWKANSTGFEIGFVDRKSGQISTTKYQSSELPTTRKLIGGKLFLKFKSETVYLDKTLKVTKLSREWFPVCRIPQSDMILVQNSDCTYLGVADTNLANVTKSLKISVCYDGVPGLATGEVYLMPNASPLDFPAFRCMIFTPATEQLLKIPEMLKNLGKGTKLIDLATQLHKIKH